MVERHTVFHSNVLLGPLRAEQREYYDRRSMLYDMRSTLFNYRSRVFDQRSKLFELRADAHVARQLDIVRNSRTLVEQLDVRVRYIDSKVRVLDHLITQYAAQHDIWLTIKEEADQIMRIMQTTWLLWPEVNHAHTFRPWVAAPLELEPVLHQVINIPHEQPPSLPPPPPPSPPPPAR